MLDSFSVLDTHTGGEITRIVSAADLGLSDLGLSDRSPEHWLRQLRGASDWVRKALTREPRGTEYAVGAVVAPPDDVSRTGCIVFFNNVGYLGMCGHGLIGVVEALRHQGAILPGTYQFATPAGMVQATLLPDRDVRFTGVPSRCYRQDVSLECRDGRRVTGEIAYGGNWFFLTHDESVRNGPVAELMHRAQQIRDALDQHEIRGESGALIDHVEMYCSLSDATDDRRASDPVGCRNFVLCPGGHYDRSPCGTGTSAKLACLAAQGTLEPGVDWVQESITGSRFVASYQYEEEHVHVTIRGRAHVIAETRQVFDPDDDLRFGIGEQCP
ncbi:4-hydroxyproline epimerase [Stieleria maiorica]|uniref:4-hydroxyproline epimerase n=1 Tax=Stieleria maiorica TaxID=2795974 RepID=A0A5B9MQE6_9BACT|nr:proline racemase family protein [Stieleria maiorica]QEG01986.1 4-hydroxyproline epimerase [Stieleria maiorica]